MFRLVKKQVVVNTKSDQAFRGILWKRWFGLIVLKNAEMLKKGGGMVKMDGEVVIFIRDVDFIQVLQ